MHWRFPSLSRCQFTFGSQICEIIPKVVNLVFFCKLSNLKEYFKEKLRLDSVLEGPLRNSFRIPKDLAGL